MSAFLSKLFGRTKAQSVELNPPLQLSEALVSKFESLKKPCITIKTTAVEMDRITLGESRFGGVPDTPEDFVWPSFNGVSFPFIAQIDFEKVAPLDVEGLLPPCGHLLVFYEGGNECWGFRPDDNKYWSIQYVGPGTKLVRQSPPANLPDWPVIRPGKLDFAEGISYADAWDFATNDWSEEERRSYAQYKDQLQLPIAGHQLLGHSRNVQNDMKLECQLTSNGLDCGDASGYKHPRRKELEHGAADWTLLLQFDTDDALDVMWGDAGTIYLWIRKQDLAAKNFGKARICFQCC